MERVTSTISGLFDQGGLVDRMIEAGRQLGWRRLWIVAFSVLFAFVRTLSDKLVTGFSVYSKMTDTYVKERHGIDIFLWILLTALVYLICILLICAIEALSPHAGGHARRHSKLVFFGFFACIFLCWVPYLLVHVPGGIFSDTSSIIKMANYESPLTNHHPVLYTLLWRLTLYAGGYFNGVPIEHSMEIFTVVQAIFLALALAAIVYVIYVNGASAPLVAIALVYFSLFELVPLYVVSLWKDTPFGVAVALYSAFLLHVFWNEGSTGRLGHWHNLVFYGLLIVAVSFLRNNGSYVVAVTGVAVFIGLFFRRRVLAVRYGLVSLFVVLATFIIQGPMFTAAGLNEDRSVETLGIPLQQVAYVISNGGTMPSEDLAFMNRVIPVETLKEEYCPMIVDPIKWSDQFDTEYFESHVGAFLQVWMRAMRNNPEMAEDSYLLATVGFWDVSRQTYDGYICATMWPGLDFQQRDVLKELTGINLADRMHTPVLVSSATFGWMMLLCASICLARRHNVRVIPLLPGLLVWATILIATPLAFSMRYVFPLVLVTPLAMVTSLVPGEGELRQRTGGYVVDDEYYYEDGEGPYLDDVLPKIDFPNTDMPNLPEI